MAGRGAGHFAEWFIAHDWYRLPDGTQVRAKPRTREERTWILICDRPYQLYSVESDGKVFIIQEQDKNRKIPERCIRAAFDASDIKELYSTSYPQTQEYT